MTTIQSSGTGQKRDDITLVVAGVIIQDDKVLLGQRAEGSHLEGFCEFPGGKVNNGETPQQSLRRELREELGVELVVADALTFTYHRYPEKNVLILFYSVILDTPPVPGENQVLKWVDLSGLRDMEMPPADQPVVELLSSRRK